MTMRTACLKLLALVGNILLQLPSSSKCFTVVDLSRPTRWSTPKLSMVRNVDLCETLIFYGDETLFHETHNNKGDNETLTTFLPGVVSLMEECARDDTAVVALLHVDNNNSDNKALLATSAAALSIPIHVVEITQPPPNPRDLYTAIHSITVQPKGYGGSSGFGRKAADPVRTPLPRHCVVLCSTVDQCRAARCMGMRCVCCTDNDLADAIVGDDATFWESIIMDDIATPGSFWLNVCHERDDVGNKLDPLEVMEAYERTENEKDGNQMAAAARNGETGTFVAQKENNDLSDEHLAAILADIDPL